MAIGVCAALYLCFLIKVQYYRKNLTVFMFITYVFANAAAVAFSRAELGAEHALAERYAIYSLLLFALYYLTLLELIDTRFRTRIACVCVVATLFVYASLWPTLLNRMDKHRIWTTSSLCEWRINRTGLLYPDAALAAKVMEQAAAKGFFLPPFHLCKR
jgi:hypothetical protein